ncbi:MAG: T9SS type A sorting domain-containing protein [Bacteroidota bacterium]
MSHGSHFTTSTRIAVVVGFLLLGVSHQAFGAGTWWNSNWHYRVPVTVSAAGYERYDKPVEVTVNFTSVLSSLGRSGAVAAASIHVVETDLNGTLLDTAVAFQFDRATGYDSTSNASGNLIFLMKGTTATGATRYFTVYFDLVGTGYASESVPAQVSYTDNVTYAGQASYQISTPEATFYYHKAGGGFAGMKDKNNNEWLGFDPTPGSGSGGEYRGVPNAVFVLNQPQNSYFHPGFTNSTSTVVHSGPLKLTIDSKSTDSGNPWESQWEIFPTYARMTMLVQGNSTYWFLYEGTPGGAYNATTNYVVRSDGQRNPGSDSWLGAVGDPEFVYFGDQAVKRVLYFVHHETDALVDSYRPQDNLMTVFGFSRDYTTTSYFNSAPQHFTMGFSEDTTFAGASKVISSSFKSIAGSLGSPEELSLTAPALVSPLDNAINTSTTLQFVWHGVASASSYRIQVSTSSSFAGGFAVDDSTVADTTRQVAGLQQNTIYYWRVRAQKDGLAGPYAAQRKFTTGIGTPVPVAPPQGATGVSSPVILRWTTIVGATAYRVQLGTDQNFSTGIVVDDASITDTSRQVSGLGSGVQYYWHVLASNTNGASAYSPVWNFITGLPAPTLASPADNGVVGGTTATLRWFSLPGSVAYHVQLSTDPAFVSNVIVNDSTVSDTTRNVTGLLTGNRYYWRVRGIGTSTKGSFSNARSFVTALAAPQVLSPADKATMQPLVMTFSWNVLSGAQEYHLQLATDSTFQTGFVKNDSSIVDTFRIVAGLKNNTRYFWRLGARAASVTGVFSATRSFKTVEVLPGLVALLSPPDGATISSDSVSLIWQAPDPPASRYWIEVGLDSTFSLRDVDSTTTDTVRVQRHLIQNQRYFWRVRAGNDDTWTAFSGTRSFSTVDLAVVGNPGQLRDYALAQNYPNPFNPSTTIEFSVPREGRVVLEVFNLMGEKVTTLVNGMRSPGTYREQFDGSKLTSGVYFYRLITPEGTRLRKMMMLK